MATTSMMSDMNPCCRSGKSGRSIVREVYGTTPTNAGAACGERVRRAKPAVNRSASSRDHCQAPRSRLRSPSESRQPFVWKELILFSAMAKTLGQMNDPRIRGVIGKTLALAVVGYLVFVVLIYLVIGWLSGLTGWLEGLAQFGGVIGAVVIAWFLFPSVAAAIAGIFADEVIDAVEAVHY